MSDFVDFSFKECLQLIAFAANLADLPFKIIGWRGTCLEEAIVTELEATEITCPALEELLIRVLRNILRRIALINL